MSTETRTEMFSGGYATVECVVDGPREWLEVTINGATQLLPLLKSEWLLLETSIRRDEQDLAKLD